MVRNGFFGTPVANYRAAVAVPVPCLPEGRAPVLFRRVTGIGAAQLTRYGKICITLLRITHKS